MCGTEASLCRRPTEPESNPPRKRTREAKLLAGWVLVLWGLLPLQAQGQGAKVRVSPRVEGEVEDQELSVDLAYVMKLKRGTLTTGDARRRWKLEQDRRVEFREVGANGRVTEVDVFYRRAARTEPGKGRHPLAVAKREYRCRRIDDKKVVVDGSGRPVSSDEKRKVLADTPELHGVTPLERFLHGKPAGPGRSFSGGESAGAVFFGVEGEKGLRFRRIRWVAKPPRTLAGEECLIFSTRVSATALQEGFSIPLELEGEIAVFRETGRVHRWQLGGTLKFQEARAIAGIATEISLTGELDMHRVHSHGR